VQVLVPSSQKLSQTHSEDPPALLEADALAWAERGLLLQRSRGVVGDTEAMRSFVDKSAHTQAFGGDWRAFPLPVHRLGGSSSLAPGVADDNRSGISKRAAAANQGSTSSHSRWSRDSRNCRWCWVIPILLFRQSSCDAIGGTLLEVNRGQGRRLANILTG
jgi:hypothetical protein